MRERNSGSRGRSFPARPAGALALAVVLGSAALARGATTFQASYLYTTSGPASGGTVSPIVGNKFQAGATVTVGGVPVSATFHNSTRIGATMPALTPGALYDVVVTNPGGATKTIPFGWFADFSDVAASNPFHASVESILRDQITSGCTGGNYCPNDPITRAQMAVFLLRAEHGGDYMPPAASGTVFADVGQSDFAADWIEQLYAEGITGGCTADPPGPPLPNYCPNSSVTRAQMAVFLLKVYEGVSHVPPPATGVFVDCPLSDPALAPLIPWIEELARLQVTVGCGNDGFCPNDPNTRGQMAVFMTKTFHRSQAIRFLEQASWGPSDGDVGTVLSQGYLPWMASQFSLYPSYYPTMLLWPGTAPSSPVDCTTGTCHRDNYTMYPLHTRLFLYAMYNPDQLRQRVVWSLHRLNVASGFALTRPSQMVPYLNLLEQNTFGNYRDILYNVTLNPGMGAYLNMSTNTATNPNENYAREVMQLFSLGTEMLSMDGTTQNDGFGVPLPTYDQTVIDNLKLVLTGWEIASNVPCDPFSQQGSVCTDYLNPMTFNSSKHDATSKVLFPPPFLPNADGVGSQTNVAGDPSGYSELNTSIDALFNHPNAGPYLARELIHSLVTSNPSPDYVERVAWSFNDDGNGVRGSLWAVVKAILLDPEARNAPSSPTYGKLKEPEQLVLNVLKAFSPKSTNRLNNSDGNINSQTKAMGQDTYKPITVFSYYPQDYFAPPASLEVLGPEFGIMDASTSLKRANFFNTMTFGGGIQPVPPDTPNGTSIDFTELQLLAPDAGNLVDRLNRLLMHGTMSDEMKASIITAVNAVTPSTDTLKRARQALYLVATASQYQAQR
ncbi:MAG: DUF1800 family protein [Acidobacteriota bacterium]